MGIDVSKLSRDEFDIYTWAREYVSTKEIKESFAFVNKIRRFISGKKVVYDLCCGHGLVGATLVYRGLVKYAILVSDKRYKSHDELIDSLGLQSRVYYVYRDIFEDNTFITEPDAVVSVHACGELSDRVIDIAKYHNVDVYLMPCCYGKIKNHYKYDELLKIFGKDKVDYFRVNELLGCGYSVNVRKIPESITPMNTVICARSNERSGR